MDLSKYNIPILKACLSELKDKISGNKSDLIIRLQAYDAQVVKGLIEKYAATQGHETEMDTTTGSNNGEDEVASLKGEVAILKDTVQQLVQKLQILISDPKASDVVPPTSGAQRDAAEPVPCAVAFNIRNDAVQASQPVFVEREASATEAAGSEPNRRVNVNLPEVNMVQARMLLTNPSPVNETTPVVNSVINSLPHAQFGNQGVHNFNTSAYCGPSVYGGQRSVYQSRQDLGGLSPGNVDVRDIVRIMPEFCPGSGLSSAMFIDRINQLSRAYGWSEQMILYAIYDKLKGPARQWINAMPIFNRWNDFIQAFLADFPCDVNAAELNIKMMKTRMTRDESYLDYFYKMLALGRSGDMQDSAIITYVINGLYDDTMRKILSAMHFARCSDLLRTLTNFQGDRRPTMQQGPNHLHTVSTQNQQNANLKMFKPTQAPNVGVVCFRCRERGHIAKNCPKFKKLNGAERINHINASEMGSEEEQSAIINNIAPMRKRQELLQKVTILCKPEVTCEALIDSGSGKSLIKRSIANKCAISRSTCDDVLSGFARGELKCSEKMNVEVQFDQVSYPAELLIVEDGAMKYDVLIGIDVLAKGTVIIEKGVCRVMPINDNKINVGKELSTNAVHELKATLNTFAHCFGEELHELGKSKRFKMDIKVTSDKPIMRKPYPIPIPKQQIVEQMVDELLELGIIQPSKSAYSSPIVLVKKQNGENRMCIDYRELNSITEKQPWHMPTVDGVLATLSNKKFFTTLDMMSGYYQLELEEASKPFTAFVTHNGHFEFCRMPFGLRNAPSAFQRMMAELIAPLGKAVTSYVDEVIIATETEEANIAVLVKFLKAVEQEGLTLRLSKCSFLQRAVSFLGHEVDGNGIRPGEKTISALRKYPTPRNQHEVRRFLGLAGFFRKFVPNFAMIAKPLSNLLRKDVNFVWSSDCEYAFQKLIQVLTQSPVLVVYNVGSEHQLHTDASGVGLAAILLQREEDAWKPVAYFSRACTDAESKYHAYELEVLAIVEGCQRFRTYLLGKQFSIVTDCHSIASAKIHKPMIPRVARWFLKLMEYDYTVIHRPGESMRHVDALSRAPNDVCENDAITDATVMEISVNDWVSTLQRTDPTVKSIMDVLSGLSQSDQKKQFETEYCLQQNRLFRKRENKLLLVVPKGVRWRLLKLCHDDAGHHGVDGTIKRISEHFWFPRMRNFTKGYVKSCIDCSYHRQPQIKQCELYGMDIPKLPFQVIHMDHLGPFVKSKRGNEFILVIVDALSRYTIIVPVRSTKTKPVVDAMNQLTLYFGLPQTIVTDRGTAFTSASFNDFCKSNGIQHIKVAVRTPRANGLAERVNQSVLKFLKTATVDKRGWDCELRLLQWTLNTTVNATTRRAPIDLVFDFPLRDLSGNKLLNAIHDDMHIIMNDRRSEAIANINNARNKWKERFDAKHRVPIKYTEGDLVLIEVPPISTGESKKLQPMYRGPYEVKKALRFDRYVVGDIDGMQNSKRKFSTVAASDKMKPWCSLFPELDDGYEDEDDSDQ